MPKPIHDIGQICKLDKWETFINGQPFDTFKQLRAEAPIYWHEEDLDFEPGFWALTKHEDIIKVSKDPKTFSSAVGGHLMTMGDPEVVDPAAVGCHHREYDRNGSSGTSDLQKNGGPKLYS